tara:strand:- start:1577 stop:1780 length:204 start_codon:yes stop_codon:yes gene_type:complete
MATSGTQRLQRKSLSSERAQRTIEAIETVVGISIGSDPSYYPPGKETLSERKLGYDNEGSVDKTNKW